MFRRIRFLRRWRWVLRIIPVVVVWSLIAAVPVVADEGQRSWYMDTFRVEEMWQHATGEGVTVAIIDSGVDDSIPELEGRVREGKDLSLEGSGVRRDDDGHGTDMASLIAGSGAGGGIQGLAPDARILPIKVDTMLPGELEFSFEVQQHLASAIQYAVNSGARIINLSIGNNGPEDSPEALRAAVAEAARADVLIFAAVGNAGEAENEIGFIAGQEGIVAVAAVDALGERAEYSTYGPEVALAAPAEDIFLHCGDDRSSLCLESGGTSSATALVSASAALIWSAHPDWTKNQVLRVLLETADGPEGRQRDEYIGFGMVRPDRVLVDGEGEPGRADTSPLFPTYEASLDPPVSPAPSAPEGVPEEGRNEDSDPSPGAPSEGNSRQALAGSSGASGVGPWVLFGLAGVVLVGGIVMAVLLGRRRATRPDG